MVQQEKSMDNMEGNTVLYETNFSSSISKFEEFAGLDWPTVDDVYE